MRREPDASFGLRDGSRKRIVCAAQTSKAEGPWAPPSFQQPFQALAQDGVGTTGPIEKRSALGRIGNLPGRQEEGFLVMGWLGMGYGFASLQYGAIPRKHRPTLFRGRADRTAWRTLGTCHSIHRHFQSTHRAVHMKLPAMKKPGSRSAESVLRGRPETARIASRVKPRPALRDRVGWIHKARPARSSTGVARSSAVAPSSAHGHRTTIENDSYAFL